MKFRGSNRNHVPFDKVYVIELFFRIDVLSLWYMYVCKVYFSLYISLWYANIINNSVNIVIRIIMIYDLVLSINYCNGDIHRLFRIHVTRVMTKNKFIITKQDKSLFRITVTIVNTQFVNKTIFFSQKLNIVTFYWNWDRGPCNSIKLWNQGHT